MQALNGTHLHFEQMMVEKNNVLSGATQIDSFWVIKHKHGPYPTRGCASYDADELWRLCDPLRSICMHMSQSLVSSWV